MKLEAKRQAIYSALADKISQAAVLVLMTWINRFPEEKISAQEMTILPNHGDVVKGLSVKPRKYWATVKELRRAGYIERKKARDIGEFYKIRFDILDGLAGND